MRQRPRVPGNPATKEHFRFSGVDNPRARGCALSLLPFSARWDMFGVFQDLRVFPRCASAARDPETPASVTLRKTNAEYSLPYTRSFRSRVKIS